MLTMLGLDDVAARTYRTLVGMPSAHPGAVAAAAGLETAAVVTALATLERRGLAARSTAGSDQYVPSPPALALGSLIVEHREELRRAELELASLDERYREGAATRTVTDVLDVVTGRQGVTQRFQQMQRGARQEILALVKADAAAVSSSENEVDESAAVARGVSYRVLAEQGVLDEPGFLDEARESLERGEQLRITREVPLRMIIADRELALLPLFPAGRDASRQSGALLVHPSALLDGLLALFDTLYENAAPLDLTGELAGGSHHLAVLDTQVLTLLMAGLTDRAVGTHLDLSIRTVQRRVSAMMDRVGVTTRLQLGYEAHRRGWLVAEAATATG